MPSSLPFKAGVGVLLFDPKPGEGLQDVLQYVPCSWEPQGSSPIPSKAKADCGLGFASRPCLQGSGGGAEGSLGAFMAKSVETTVLG